MILPVKPIKFYFINLKLIVILYYNNYYNYIINSLYNNELYLNFKNFMTLA